MSKELELWTFIADCLRRGEQVMLLVVAESVGSSPGRAGFKMAVAADGELCGSIGGGVMEVSLVELAKGKSKRAKGKTDAEALERIHRKDVANSSGMICSGKQTVILKQIADADLDAVERVRKAIENGQADVLTISKDEFSVVPSSGGSQNAAFGFERRSDQDFIYQERLGAKNRLFIIGGGHCALALSDLMSKMDFRISIFDDRPELNTLSKNEFADEIAIIDGYDKIAEHVPNGDDVYVVVMTLGYASDAIVIRQLIGHEIKYLGVLGSKAKMATLMKDLEAEGISADKLARIHTPIGLAINSRTPEEIAVSIAAEIITLKNR